MIKIEKKKEPKEWTEYRNTPGVDYQSIPELVESLLKEQGYICVHTKEYCRTHVCFKIFLFSVHSKSPIFRH